VTHSRGPGDTGPPLHGEIAVLGISGRVSEHALSDSDTHTGGATVDRAATSIQLPGAQRAADGPPRMLVCGAVTRHTMPPCPAHRTRTACARTPHMPCTAAMTGSGGRQTSRVVSPWGARGWVDGPEAPGRSLPGALLKNQPHNCGMSGWATQAWADLPPGQGEQSVRGRARHTGCPCAGAVICVCVSSLASQGECTSTVCSLVSLFFSKKHKSNEINHGAALKLCSAPLAFVIAWSVAEGPDILHCRSESWVVHEK